MTKSVLLTVNVHGLGPEAVNAPEEHLFGRLAHGRYTYRIGLSRVLDAMRTWDVRATFFWPVFEAERCGSLFERCIADGHEIGSHGQSFESLSSLGDREAEVLERACDRLEQLCGTRPAGFRSPDGTVSYATLSHLRRLGYLYDSSFVDDDFPYLLDEDGAPGMVELPLFEGLTDATHFSRLLTQERVEAFFNEELDALLSESGYACLTLHPRADKGIGRAARLPLVERLLQRARDSGGQIVTGREFAEHYLKRRAL
ncbi:polysaccharide deacetylase family protein [Microvirga sp. VF16]|uniref:polysaccharide deacetylase family protein n=1 Tax=Microvirga sp. VF16 TaxID=2807101 RepID=UPI00193E8895|nr:polysaccharide deacetylase family protein [Microvirga sp. VF16]QRM34277.1 polysaccharide deacetylase family protein [Microvirga sp. VF16]